MKSKGNPTQKMLYLRFDMKAGKRISSFFLACFAVSLKAPFLSFSFFAISLFLFLVTSNFIARSLLALYS